MPDPVASAEAFAEDSGATPVIVTHDTPQVAQPVQKFYTEDDLSRVRSQEKDKLYPTIEDLKGKLSQYEKAEQDREARFAAEKAEADAKIREKLESEMEAKDLIKLKEQEWNQRLDAERQERERAFALLEREQTFNEVQRYTARRVGEEQENIIPALVDLVTGNTPDEVEQSIASLKERSARIFDSVQQASQSARRDMVGTRPTLPSAGPLDTNSEQRTFTAKDIAEMSMADYAKNRPNFLSQSARGVTQGLFGSN